MKNKKGMEFDTVKSLIIIAVFVVIAVLIARDLFPLIGGYLNGAECGWSATLASISVDEMCVIDTHSPFALNCPRTNLVFAEEGLYSTFKGDKKLQKVTPSAQTVEQQVALEMVDCWEKFGSGQLALFPEGDEGLWNAVTRSLGSTDKTETRGYHRTVCHVCAEMSFNTGIQGVNLQKSLNVRLDKPVREILNNPQAHCQENYRGGSCWENLEAHITSEAGRGISKMGVVDTSKTYAVVMMRHGYDWCTDEEEKGFELTNFVYVVPQDELSTACDMVVT